MLLAFQKTLLCFKCFLLQQQLFCKAIQTGFIFTKTILKRLFIGSDIWGIGCQQERDMHSCHERRDHDRQRQKSIRDIFARKVSVRLKRSPNHILSLCLQEFPWRFRSTLPKATVITIGLDKKVHIQLFHFQFDRRRKRGRRRKKKKHASSWLLSIHQHQQCSPNKK